MSYDLYFYKLKASGPSSKDIENYLNNNLVINDQNSNEWVFENPDTEVYYYFERSEPSEPDEDEEQPEGFSDFEDTGFSFAINFMRPSFFGLEAFPFVEKMMLDLNLFILNPQGNSELPYRPSMDELYENWNKTNLWSSKDHYDDMQSSFIPENKSRQAWEYNFRRKQLQAEFAETCFIPKIFFYKTKVNNNVITIATWAYSDPNIFPPVDYFLLGRQRKRWFKTITETVVISHDTLIKEFGPWLEEFSFKDCKIIRPRNASLAKQKFNSIHSQINWPAFAERLSMDKLYNAKPD